jgi:phosphate transport system substrate-binding protein
VSEMRPPEKSEPRAPMSAGRRRALLLLALLIAAIVGTAAYFGISSLLAADAAPYDSLQITGSESMRPVIAACAEDFMSKSPQSDVIVRGGGSGEGISALLHGLVEMGMSSRPLTEKEQRFASVNGIALSISPFAIDGIAIIVHPSNPLDELDLLQLKAVYAGKIRSWRDLGGAPDGEILTIARASGSGTASLFAERVLGGTEAQARQKFATNEAIVDEVAGRPDAMGYSGLGAVHKAGDRIKILAIRADPQGAAVAPLADSLRSGDYPLARTLYLLGTSPPTKIAESFLSHCLGPSGVTLLQRAGYVSTGAVER